MWPDFQNFVKAIKINVLIFKVCFLWVWTFLRLNSQLFFFFCRLYVKITSYFLNLFFFWELHSWVFYLLVIFSENYLHVLFLKSLFIFSSFLFLHRYFIFKYSLIVYFFMCLSVSASHGGCTYWGQGQLEEVSSLLPLCVPSGARMLTAHAFAYWAVLPAWSWWRRVFYLPVAFIG